MMLRKYFLLFAVLILLPATVSAATLVNINTADKATLMTLSGLGGTGVKAQAVIDYRTQNGPFAAIEDIMNVSGIGTATFNTIKDSITVGGAAPAPQDPAPTQSQAQPQPQTQTAQSSGGAIPPPITAQITTDTAAVAGAGTLFEGAAFGTQGQPLLSGVRYLWNFGDGGVAEGARVLHTYEYPGVYDVQVSVGYNYSSATARLVVAAVAAQVALVAEGDGSLTVVNNSSNDLDIGRWSLRQFVALAQFRLLYPQSVS